MTAAFGGKVWILPGVLWDTTCCCLCARSSPTDVLSGPFLQYLSHMLGAEPRGLTQVSVVCSDPPTWKLVIPAANWLCFCTAFSGHLLPQTHSFYFPLVNNFFTPVLTWKPLGDSSILETARCLKEEKTFNFFKGTVLPLSSRWSVGAYTTLFFRTGHQNII